MNYCLIIMIFILIMNLLHSFSFLSNRFIWIQIKNFLLKNVFESLCISMNQYEWNIGWRKYGINGWACSKECQWGKLNPSIDFHDFWNLTSWCSYFWNNFSLKDWHFQNQKLLFPFFDNWMNITDNYSSLDNLR